ncbi:MAG: zinc transport system substrate-binding protein [Actinomycetota bacterium]|nr:zinc transport system substrate-binding protein [Actinomycetota bacterium]
MRPRRLLAAASSIVAALAMGACTPSSSAGNSAGKLDVVASFYPLEFATEQVGGSHVAVTSLTRPGAEPHDIELTPRGVASVSRAKLVIYERGLQAAVDKAVDTQAGEHGLDIAPAARLDLSFRPAVGAPATAAGENAPGTRDPHFWLDPQRYSGVAAAIAQRLSSLDPANKADYQKNAKAFDTRLAALSQDFQAGLAHCQRKEIVTSHAAFGYLARRFGMTQIAITGLSPQAEPSPTELAAVSTYARRHGVTTIYAETLVSPAIAETVAREAGAKVATLDPIEGLTNTSRGKDYFEVMHSNLTTLRAGQKCS